MIYPILVKRILRRIRDSFEYTILNRTNNWRYDIFASWLTQYFELDEKDHINIITKIERSQTSSIMYAMRKKDPEIFINQLGCFYIKQTTSDFYNALAKLIGDRDVGESEYEEIKKSALEETRANYIRRAIYKKNCRNGKAITIEFK